MTVGKGVREGKGEGEGKGGGAGGEEGARQDGSESCGGRIEAGHGKACEQGAAGKEEVKWKSKVCGGRKAGGQDTL